MCPECSKMYFFKDYEEFSTICPKCNVEMVCVGKSATSTEIEERKERERRLTPPVAIVECPYCHSVNTSKISAVSKAGSVAMFGIFSQKVKHQWHCNSCKSDF